MMPARTVHVTVADLVLGGGTDFHYFHSKVQVYAGQRVIAVDRYSLALNGGNRDHSALT
jgi:hypothetical protein